jgi:hypothetical protein
MAKPKPPLVPLPVVEKASFGAALKAMAQGPTLPEGNWRRDWLDMCFRDALALTRGDAGLAARCVLEFLAMALGEAVFREEKVIAEFTAMLRRYEPRQKLVLKRES